MATLLTNARVLTDDGFVRDRAVRIDEGRIAALVPASGAHGAEAVDLGGAYLLPGFIDVQVNGGGGALFNDAPTVETIRAIGEAHRRFGTAGFLPTLISDDPAAIRSAIDAADKAIAARVPGVLGVHVEGPFINVERRGAHDAAKIRALGDQERATLASLRGGRTLVTLAPELAPPGAIASLAQAGVAVSAGHTNATFEQMQAAFDAGLRGVTHLFNAMPPFTSRELGVVGAALLDDRCWCGIIADGRHVHPESLRLAMRAKRADRFLLVTDAMPCVGTGASEFMLQGRRIHVRDGVCVDDRGVLSGSALDMASAVRNVMRYAALPLETAVRMASANPAEFLGLGGELGRIAPGLRASFVVADDSLRVLETWIDGERFRCE